MLLHVCRFFLGISLAIVTSALPIMANAETPATEQTGVRAVAGGLAHTCAISHRGHVWCWGENFQGQLGDGTTRGKLVPTRVVDLEGRFTAISTGQRHSCALSEAGRVYCWGANDDGQLGDGTTMPSARLIEVRGLGANVSTISLGLFHSCAIARNGRVRCWGANERGQLGIGTTEESSRIETVSGLSGNVRKLAAGDKHTCALDRNGRAFCWGYNLSGQLGIGNNFDRNIATRIADTGGNNLDIAAGSQHSCLLNRAGRAWCWGRNFYGQLGNLATIDSFVPVRVARLGTDVQALSLGGFQGSSLQGSSCAINANGRAMCWGYGVEGQLGTGTTANFVRPQRVLRVGTGVRAVAAARGGNHTCFINDSGRLFCTGSNMNGQLGTGDTVFSATPIPVAGNLHRN